jgi:hypothetical protein
MMDAQLQIVAFIRMGNLFLSREFESGEFSRIGDEISIDGEEFEVLTITRIEFNMVAIEVVCSRPPELIRPVGISTKLCRAKSQRQVV